MLNFYKTVKNHVTEVEELSEGCWISVVSPTQTEIDYLVEKLGLEPSFVRAALDDEETSRIETEDGQTLIIVDTPMVTKESEKNTILYTTTPIGIILTQEYIITVCHKETPVISELADGVVKNIQTHLKTRFLLMLLLRVATRYLQYLKQIDKISDIMEKQLHRSMRNKELIQLLGLEKSLVYFSTSLKGNEITLEKILRGRTIKLYEEDQDLLEDVLIEIKQAIEMSNIYSSILSGMMDAFASIISNNLNIVMKVLTSITILMAIPTMIASFYGMNVEGLPLEQFWWFPLVISGVVTTIVAIILIRSNMFSSK
jgi:magnesium transporter